MFSENSDSKTKTHILQDNTRDSNSGGLEHEEQDNSLKVVEKVKETLTDVANKENSSNFNKPRLRFIRRSGKARYEDEQPDSKGKASKVGELFTGKIINQSTEKITTYNLRNVKDRLPLTTTSGENNNPHSSSKPANINQYYTIFEDSSLVEADQACSDLKSDLSMIDKACYYTSSKDISNGNIEEEAKVYENGYCEKEDSLSEEIEEARKELLELQSNYWLNFRRSY
jgi:hypothetical protein